MERAFTRAFLRRATMTLLLAVLTTATAWAQGQEPVSYIDVYGQTQDCTEYIELRSELFEGDEALNNNNMPSGWYVVKNWNKNKGNNGGIDFDYDGTLGFQGDAHIILCDGATMRVTSYAGSPIGSIGTLAIYGQTGGTGTLYASNTYDSGIADAIVGNDGVIINGGTIHATTAGSDEDSHAIYVSWGDLTINGGTVKATAGGEAYALYGFNVHILGGTVTANGTVGTRTGYEDRGTITLGGRNATDQITATAYEGTTVKIVDGQYLYNGSELLSGTVSDVSKVSNKTLVSHITYTDDSDHTQTTPIDWATQSTGASAADPYMIYHPAHLLLLAYRVNGTHGETANGYKNKYFKLGADIAFSYEENEDINDYDENYEVIGCVIGTTIRYFKGKFDGNNKTVSGIRIRKTGSGETDNYQGLFGCIDEGASIHDVRLTDARITGYWSIGGIVGYNDGGIVSNCTVTESAITADTFEGTICGFNNSGTLSHNYYRHCTVNGTPNATGHGVGNNDGADITDETEGAMPMYVAYTAANGSTAKCFDYTELTSGAADLPAGWYVVNSNVTVNSRINFTGDTNLILGDGYTLNVKGIYIPQGSTLTIYAQSDGETAGKIVSHPSDGAAIGGKSGNDNGNIVIHGGNIEAEGTDFCAGIGSNDGQTGGTITIYGGTITAKGGDGGAAIGGGRNCSGGTITINGGTITANGPTDSETNEYGAGIGGGDYGDGGNITINGGNITTYSRDGAGIGGGDNGAGGTITINGGTITSERVNQGQGARIGGGCDGAPGTITINGGTITTVGGKGAGIGGGKNNTTGGTVTINGGIITASGSYGIGAGDEGANVAITLGYTEVTKDAISITSSSFVGMVTLDNRFYNDNGVFYEGEQSDLSLLAGSALRPYNQLTLSDDADNSTAIDNADSKFYNKVTLAGRTFYKDGAWNTLCLPFSMDATQIEASDLAGATIKEMASTSNLDNNGTLTLNFTPVYDGTAFASGFTQIDAGKPYIVKWESASGTVSDPLFSGVAITSTEPTAVKSSDQKVTFVGQYSPFSIVASGATGSNQGNLNEIIMLGANNTLGYSQNPRTLKCFRAHFYVKADGGVQAARAFVMNFGDGETTGIVSMEDGGWKMEDVNDAWYSIDGRKLNGEPTQKGVYIQNGRKIVIK